MNKQKNYVPPGIKIYRIKMEVGIAAPTSVSKFTADAESWADGGTWGADPSSEDGDVYLTW
ncbi:MAG: hypothetical protein LBB85_00040 [Dysgonamonadaceae bacterium]|jgi:hypothetical protein|nr:hypothetical protein [Dysgonamonadaceae bacterium]